MKFLYKIHSAYDGFTPTRVPTRAQADGRLRLGWVHYLDSVDKGDAVWVYFLGPHRFDNGVYVKGVVSDVNRADGYVLLTITERSATSPLITNQATSDRIAQVVAPRRRQVFVLPEYWAPAAGCNVFSTGTTCDLRQCNACPGRTRLHTIHNGEASAPNHLQGRNVRHYSAFWVRPRRCCVSVNEPIRQVTELFHRFKLGEERLAYPFAVAMASAIAECGLLQVDAVVPVPLSPDKAQEINRARLLAHELSRLLNVPLADVLRLTAPISKRQLKEDGWTDNQFMRAYSNRLDISNRIIAYQAVLIVDDVSTHGLTLRTITDRIRRMNPKCALHTATAGQMVVQAALTNTSRVR
jgi:predicted amidophosphoribosyltransferase